MKVGDRVKLTFEEQTVEATVILISPNRRSLGLEFDGLVGGYAGRMPLQDSSGRGVYRDLIMERVAQVEPLEAESS